MTKKVIRTDIKQCPLCKSAHNSYTNGGYAGCFHCGKCGWTECGANVEKLKQEREQAKKEN